MKKQEELTNTKNQYQGKNKEYYTGDASFFLTRFLNGLDNAMSAGWEGGVASWHYYQKKLAETKGQTPKITIPSMGYNTGTMNSNPYLINYEREKANKTHLDKVQSTMNSIRDGVELEAKTEEDKQYIQQAKQAIEEENKISEALQDKAEFETMVDDYVSSLPNSVAKVGVGLTLGLAEYVSNPVRLGADVVAGTALSTIGGLAGLGVAGKLALDYGADIFTDVAFDSFERKLRGEEDSTFEEKLDVAKDTVVNKTILMLGGKVVKKLMHIPMDKAKVDDPTPSIVTSPKEMGKAIADTVTDRPMNSADKANFHKKMNQPDTAYDFARDNRNLNITNDTEIDRAIYQPSKNEYVQGKNYFTKTDLQSDDIKIINENEVINNIDTNVATETKMNLENEYRQKANDKVFDNVVDYETNTKGINEVQNNYKIDPYNKTIIKNNAQTILENKEEALKALFEIPDAMRAVYIDPEDNMKTEIIKWNDDEIYMIKSPQTTKANKEVLARHNLLENNVIRNNALSSAFLIDKNGNIVQSLSKGSIQKLKNQKVADEIETLLGQNIYDLSKELEIRTSDIAVQGNRFFNSVNTSADDITKSITNIIRAVRNDLQSTDLDFLKTLKFKNKNGKVITLNNFENILDGTLDNNQVLRGLLNMPVEQEDYGKLGKFFREKASIERALNKGTAINENYVELFNDKRFKTEILNKIFIEDVDGNVKLNTTKDGFFKNGIEETILYYSINPNAIDSGEGLFAGVGDRETLKQLFSYVKDEFDIDDIHTYALNKFLNSDEMDIALELGMLKQDDVIGGNILTPATFIEGFANLLKEISNPDSTYDKEVLLKLANNLTVMNKLPAKHIVNADGTTGKLSMNFLDYMLNNRETGTININDLNEAIKDIPKNMRMSIGELTNSIGKFIKSQKDNVDVSKLTMQTTNSAIKTLENMKKILSNEKLVNDYITSKKFQKDISNLNQYYSILSFDNENVFDVNRINSLKNIKSEELKNVLPEMIKNIDEYLSNVSSIKSNINIPEIDRVDIDTRLDDLKTSANDFATKTQEAKTRIDNVNEIVGAINNKLSVNKDVKKFVSSNKFAQNQAKLANVLTYMNAPKSLITRLMKFNGKNYVAKTDKPILSKLMSDIQGVIDRHNNSINKADTTIKELIEVINSGNATDLIGQKNFGALLDRYVKQLKGLNIDGALDSSEILEVANKINNDYNSKAIAEKFIKNAKGLQEAIGVLKQLDNIFSNKELSLSYKYIKDKNAMNLFNRLNKIIETYPEVKTELKELAIYSDMTNKLNQVFKSLGESKANSPAKRMKDIGKEINLAPLSKEEHLDNALLEKTINKKVTLQDKGLFKKYEGKAENILETELIAEKDIEVKGAFEKYVADKHKDLFKEIYNDSIQYLKVDKSDTPMSLDEFTIWYAKYLRAVDTSRSPFTITGGYSPLIKVAELFPSKEQFVDFITTRKAKGHLPYQKTSAQLIESLSSKTNLRIAEFSKLGQTTYALSKRLTKGTFNKATKSKKNKSYLSRSNVQRHILARVDELNAEGHSVTNLQEDIANRIGKNLENFGNKAMEDIQVTTKDITPRKMTSMFFRYLATQALKFTGINEASNKGNYVLSLMMQPDIHGRSVVGSKNASGKYNISYAQLKRAKRVARGIENTGWAIKDGWVNRGKMVKNIVNSLLHFKDMEKITTSPMEFTTRAKTYKVDPELIDATKAEYLYRQLAQDAKGNISKYDVVNKLGAIYNHWETGVFSTQLAQDMGQSIWGWRNTIEFINSIKNMPFENIDDKSLFILKNNGITENNYHIFQKVLNACDIENGNSIVLNLLKGNFDETLYKDIDMLDVNKVQNLVRYLHTEYGTLNPKDVFTTYKSNFTESLAMFLKRTTANLGVDDLRRTFFYQTPSGMYRPKISAQLEDKDWLQVIKWGGAGLADNYLKFVQLAVTGGVGLMAKHMVSDITKTTKDIAQLKGQISDIQSDFIENEDNANRYAIALWDLQKLIFSASKENINAFTLATSGGNLQSLVFNVIEPSLRTWINIEKGKGYTDAELRDKFGFLYLDSTEPQTRMRALSSLGITFISNSLLGDSSNITKSIAYPNSFNSIARQERDLKALSKNDKYGNKQLAYSKFVNKYQDALSYLVNKGYDNTITPNKEDSEALEKARQLMFLDDFYDNFKSSLDDLTETNVAINQNVANILLDEKDIDKKEYDKIIIDNLESMGVSKNYNKLDEVAKESIEKMIAIKLGKASEVDALKFKAEVMMFMGQNPTYNLHQIEREFIPNIDEINNKDIDIYNSFDDMPEDLKYYYNNNLKKYCTKNEFVVYANNGKSPRDIINDSINNNKFYIDKNPEEENIKPKIIWNNYSSKNIPIEEPADINITAPTKENMITSSPVQQPEDKLEMNEDIDFSGKIEADNIQVSKLPKDKEIISLENIDINDEELNEELKEPIKMEETEKLIINQLQQQPNPDVADDNIVSTLIDKSINYIKNINYKDKAKDLINKIMEYNIIHNQNNTETIIPKEIEKEIEPVDLSKIKQTIDLINKLPINKEPVVENKIEITDTKSENKPTEKDGQNKKQPVDKSKEQPKENKETNTSNKLDDIAKAKYVTRKGQGVVSNKIVKELVDIENAPKEIKWLWNEMENVNPKTGDKRIKEYFKSIGWGGLSANDNWCAGILSACYTANGYKLKNKTVNAQQFAQNGSEVKLTDVQVGDVLVFRNRNKKGQPIKTGHVNMVIYKDDKYIVAIGGNQSTTNSNERDGLNGINCKLYSINELSKKQSRKDRSDLSVIRVDKKTK